HGRHGAARLLVRRPGRRRARAHRRLRDALPGRGRALRRPRGRGEPRPGGRRRHRRADQARRRGAHPGGRLRPAHVGGRHVGGTCPVNRTYLALESRRTFRARRSYLLALVLPPVVLSVVGVTQPELVVSVALYGAILAVTGCGAAVAAERAQGWTRQLRLTPLRPGVYAATKVLAATVLGALSIVVTLALGAARGVGLPPAVWLGCALACWVVSAPFAALGLLAGYLLPVEAVTRVLSPVITLLAAAGGLFVPLDGALGQSARLLPTWGAGELARAPLAAGVDPVAVVNVLLWTLVLVAAAAWRFRRDTARV